MTKNEFVASFRREILPVIIHNEINGPDYPARRQAWNDAIDSMIKNGTLPTRAGDWTKPADIEGAKPKRAQAENIGTHDNPIRYEHVSLDDPNRKAKLEAQRDKFERDAKAGKVLCLSDLMCSHGM